MRLASCALLSTALLTTLPAPAADLRATGRAKAEQVRAAVITIRIVLKLKIGFGGQAQDQEQKVEVAGVVIDASGLTVASAATIDPSGALRKMAGGQSSRMKVESEVKETTLLLEDGTEVEADVVLKDTDLDLAFLKPREPGRRFVAVSLRPRSGTVPLLTPIFVVSRLGKLTSRALAVATGEIRASVRGPAPYYVTDTETSAFVGSVAYTADGVPLGLFVNRFSASPDGRSSGMFDGAFGRSGTSEVVLSVLRPVDKVLELAAQARTLHPPAKPEDAADH
jgi:S1-C subfamily serine protease